jgi:hypothetical protein
VKGSIVTRSFGYTTAAFSSNIASAPLVPRQDKAFYLTQTVARVCNTNLCNSITPGLSEAAATVRCPAGSETVGNYITGANTGQAAVTGGISEGGVAAIIIVLLLLSGGILFIYCRFHASNTGRFGLFSSSPSILAKTSNIVDNPIAVRI